MQELMKPQPVQRSGVEFPAYRRTAEAADVIVTFFLQEL
jgi:hypothetical protein